MGAGGGRASVNKVPVVIVAEQYLRENESKSFRMVSGPALRTVVMSVVCLDWGVGRR